MHEWSGLRYFRCKSQDPSKVNALLRELSADSEELDAPTDGPTAGIQSHGPVVPKASELEEFEEEEEEEEEEEDRKQYPHTLPKTNMSRIKWDCLQENTSTPTPSIDFQGHHGAPTTFNF